MSTFTQYSRLHKFIFFSLCSLLCLISSKGFSQSNSFNKTIYLDKHGKECIKKKHKYVKIYKETPLIVNNKTLISFEVYDKKNVIQVTGYITDSIGSKQWNGLHSFYSKSGKLEAHVLYDYHSTIEFFPEMKKYSALLKKCDTNYKSLSIRFLKNGHIKKIGYYSEDKKRICTWIRYNQFDPEIVSIYEYSDSLVKKKHTLQIIIYGKRAPTLMVNDTELGKSIQDLMAGW